GGDAVLHVRRHRLQRLLADLREVAALVDHPPHLTAHAERARLARIAAPQGAPERDPADAVGHAGCVEHGVPAAAGFHGAILLGGWWVVGGGWWVVGGGWWAVGGGWWAE